jgi:DNA repair photolyase
VHSVPHVCEHTFVRWENLTVGEDERTRLPGYSSPAVVRHFDAPEALDMRFYEVHAKSALNRVPERSRMPFRWTINPYRGCAHACVFCLAGDTPVLLADGGSRPIEALRVGDAIMGSTGPTEVLAHWSTVKPASLLVLEDGTELVASGDHRFLTPEGWECVRSLVRGRHLVRHAGAGTVRIASVDALPGERELFDITTGTGDFVADGVVSHNCFARPTHTYLDLDAGRDFEREIVVKVNAPEVLRRELARPSWRGEHVALGTNTDPYQWVEGRYKLMRGIWAALRDARNPCSILTKSPLVLRDLDLLTEIAEVADVSASFSVPTLDEKAWRATEPHTPSPRARLEAVAKLNAAGIPTGILVAPLMPGINDDPAQVDAILRAAEEAGAASVGGIGLHLRGEVRDVFMGWLRDARPDLVERYEQLYARGAYAPKAERERLSALLRGGRFKGRNPGFVLRDRRPPPVAQQREEPAQGSLF